MQAAYGVAWNIEARGESPTIDDRAWQVQVGYSDFQTQRNGAMGLQLMMKCTATISYVGKGPTHNSGLQAADIAVTLAAWLAGYQDFAFADNFEIQMEPVIRQQGAGFCEHRAISWPRVVGCSDRCHQPGHRDCRLRYWTPRRSSAPRP